MFGVLQHFCLSKDIDIRYYVLFIDDCTKYTWLFPMKNKSEVSSHFQRFVIYIQNQFSTTIKCFRSDGGGEYKSKSVTEFLATNGIIHQVSCPYTPEQNGVSERKNRHIKETAVTLMHQAHVPSKFWNYSCALAVYLINRMPTVNLHNCSPFEKLYNKTPNLDHIKVFGCACFPLMTPYTTHKLQYKTDQCVFLGFALGYKGYICYHISSKRFIISRLVIFD